MSSASKRFAEPANPQLAVLRLNAIKVAKPGALLANDLRQMILDGTLRDGAPLPTERDIVERTGLTRSAVRDAIRILQAEGLVETKPGRFGGSVARQPSDEALARYLGLFMTGRSISLLSLLQVREALGGTVASLAALNRSEDDLARLEDIGRRLEDAADDVATFLRENADWHVALAVATHNELLAAFAKAISSLVFKSTASDNLASPDIRQLVIQAHSRIVSAIRAGDAETASRRMSRHLASMSSHMKSFPARPLSFS